MFSCAGTMVLSGGVSFSDSNCYFGARGVGLNKGERTCKAKSPLLNKKKLS